MIALGDATALGSFLAVGLGTVLLVRDKIANRGRLEGKTEGDILLISHDLNSIKKSVDDLTTSHNSLMREFDDFRGENRAQHAAVEEKLTRLNSRVNEVQSSLSFLAKTKLEGNQDG